MARSSPFDMGPKSRNVKHIDRSWVAQAACRDMNPELFFPETGRGDDVAAAKRTCRRCPVQEQCLNYALEASEWKGVWGGTTERERRNIRRRRLKGSATEQNRGSSGWPRASSERTT